MTLFAIPFTCSLAVRLTLAERDLPHEVAWMRRFERRLADGSRFDDLNPKGRVPALRLADGELLTEIVAILHHLDAGAPRADAERRRHHEWLNTVATELHRPSLYALFDPATPPETTADVLTRQLPPALAHFERHLSTAPTLLGGAEPSPADYYLFWAMTLLRFRFSAHARSPALDAWSARLAARPAVAKTLADERAWLARLG